MFQLLKLRNLSCTNAVDIGKKKITSLQTELGHSINPETAANALLQGFKAILKIQLEPSRLTSTELEIASTLYKEKYSINEWNFNGKIV